MPKALSDDERQKIANAIRAGDNSCNAIAREFSRSPSTVSRIARDEGLSFERSQTKDATAALKADARARRAALAADLLEDARKVRASLWQKAKVHNWHQGKMHSRTLPQPTFADQKAIAITFAILVDKHEQLERIDSGDEDEVRGALRTLMGAVRENAYA